MSTDETDDTEFLARAHQRVPTESEDERMYSNELTLRQTAQLACKRIDIGTAVLPKPLFHADVEDLDDTTRINVSNNTNANDNANDTLTTAAGTTVSSTLSPTTTRYAHVLRQEFNAVVIEHHLKWAPLCVSEPGPLPDCSPSERFGRYDFHQADQIVDFCQANGIEKIKGHVLVWHVTTPKFLQDLEPAQVRQQLKRHIFTVMGHYRGRISCWDVVNESLAPDGTLAENVFYQKLGPGYIEDCFRWAHEADPSATLLYNDNKVEGIGTAKSDGFYNLLADLKAKNVPVHGCGIQAHFNAAGTGRNRPPTPYAVKQQIHRLGELGLTVNISEMDVRVSKLPPNDTTTTNNTNGTAAVGLRDAAQRQIYHDILAAALSEPAFDGIWLWGFTDRHTWVHSFYYDDEPCVLDESYRRKEAYYGVRDALASLTPGNRVGGCVGTLVDAHVDANGNKWGYKWMQPDPDDDGGGGGGAVGGDARPDWEQEETDDDLDSGVEADVEIFSEDNEEDITADDDDSLPPIS